MNTPDNLHILTHAVLNDLHQAFQQGERLKMEGLILSAMVTVKRLHDQLPGVCIATADLDSEEYCCAV
ncbi:hypothetical protein [Geobacter argillaceus]|uniref:Uncharacterized protein n=1 Tax=Geobacter argillaceus TaxID=345631 RepID=A0A562VG36_9BACT|nr:hypothetical protein [Geobacter argillaceus]TWJ16852.1 hypothetical protein JN12_03211 [Geobacter argillaceus]